MRFSRRHFFLGSLATPLLAAKKAEKRKVGLVRPHLLLILADGLPAWMTGCYGNHEVHTPNIDRLSQTGTRFLNSFVPAPVSLPNRNTFLTGQVSRNPEPAPAASALDHILGGDGFACQTVSGMPQPEATAAGLKFLDAQSSGKSFSLTVCYPAAGPTYESVPQQFQDLYAAERFESYSADAPPPTIVRGREMLRNRVSYLRKAAGAATALDAEVGKLLAKLYQKQFFNDTLVIFASTSGAMLGHHGLWGDGDDTNPPTMFDDVVNTPLIWSYPSRVPPGILQVELVSAYDLVPTLCDFMYIPQPAGNWCGRSYVHLATARPLLKGQTWRPMVCGHYRNTEMARVARYKLVTRDEGKGPGELYDLRLDPQEGANQYDNPEFQDVKTTLNGHLAAWKKFLIA